MSLSSICINTQKPYKIINYLLILSRNRKVKFTIMHAKIFIVFAAIAALACADNRGCPHPQEAYVFYKEKRYSKK